MVTARFHKRLASNLPKFKRSPNLERRERKRKLFRIALVPCPAIRDWEYFDADHGKELPVEVREYFIPDFSD